MFKLYSEKLVYFIIAGSVLGVLSGIFLPGFGIKTEILGTLFINALFMLFIPLIMASMIAGISSLGDIRDFGRQGGRVLVYYIATTCFAVLTGLILVNVVQPGKGAHKTTDTFDAARYEITPRPLSGGSTLTLLGDEEFSRTTYIKHYVIELLDQDGAYGVIDLEAKMTPKTVVVESWRDAGGKKIEPDPTGMGLRVLRKAKPFNICDLLLTMVPRNILNAIVEAQVLAIVIFSLVFGVILTTIGEKARPVIDFFEGLNAAVMKMVHLIMYFAPFGIYALVAHRLGYAQLHMEGGFIAELLRLGKYALTVIIGLVFHAMVTLPLILRFVGRRSVAEYARGMTTPLITAFSTASSAATLPLTMEAVVEENGVNERTASLVLPVGATINMDGTAMYEAVAALFIAQAYGIHLEPAQQAIVFFTSVLAGVGAAAIPEAGLVTMVLVLTSVGLPTEGIGIILAIDWFLDRCRTTVNVWGDAVGAGTLDRFDNPPGTDPSRE